MTRQQGLLGLAVIAALVVGGAWMHDALTDASLDEDLHGMLDPDVAKRAEALDRITARGPSAVTRLIDMLDIAGGIPRKGRARDRAKERAEGKGKSEAELLTAATVIALRSFDPEICVPALIDAFEDPNSDVRHYAGITLASIGPDAVPALSRALSGSRSVRVRTSAAWTLSLLGPVGAGAVGALTAALEDDHKDVRYTARYALAQVESGQAVYWDAMERARSTLDR